ncbi:142_t:CDS:1 [Funneliformis geosporum]|uniref:142_t:CDS:1 n=1 Tax=Funneliformis geosporum TaxID=1117311 RepID=A0A9W4WP79_9GLOM|nr:142_t:CDS:1 [Funneliformis geosporum]
MGGEWGLGTASAMEILLPESRGLFSGILQQGYATLSFGFTFELFCNRQGRMEGNVWIDSFPAILVIFIRFLVNESPVLEAHHKVKKLNDKSFLLSSKLALKLH